MSVWVGCGGYSKGVGKGRPVIKLSGISEFPNTTKQDVSSIVLEGLFLGLDTEVPAICGYGDTSLLISSVISNSPLSEAFNDLRMWMSIPIVPSTGEDDNVRVDCIKKLRRT